MKIVYIKIIKKKIFKKEYEYCWGIESKLNVFYTFTYLFVFVDIISIIIVTLSKNYNVWSFILNKISRGKYEYEEIDIKEDITKYISIKIIETILNIIKQVVTQ